MFMKSSLKLCGFSNYPEDSKFYGNANHLVVGKIKDETAGVPIQGFVGLRSKMYTFINLNH